VANLGISRAAQVGADNTSSFLRRLAERQHGALALQKIGTGS